VSERHSVGNYDLEVSGHELVVRDHSGAVIETIDLGDVAGAFSLPDGQQVDLASLILSEESDVADFETAAGPANENNPGNPATHAPASFRPFSGDDAELNSHTAAGTLGDTSLSYSQIDGNSAPIYDSAFASAFGSDAPATIPISWSRHEEWQIPENQEGGAFGRLVDGDHRDYTFDVSDTRFEVVDGILQLKDGISFDFESESFLNIDVVATSRTGETQTQSVRIDVIDENEGQTGIDLDNATVAENAAGAVIGNLTVSDPDAGDSQSFQLSDNRFEVVGGQLKLKDGVSLDFETDPSVNVTVTATDKGGNSISQLFTIVVGDANEAQTSLSLSGGYVAENAAGAVIGNLTVVDPDAGDSQTFMVSDDRFEVVGGQLKLKDNVSLDFEAEPTVNVTVTATDKGGNSIAEQFTLGVGDVNEAQTALSIDNHLVAENATGAVVGTLNVIDPDAGDSQSFQVSDGRFEVVGDQLKLKSNASLDFETEPQISVTVTATDKGGHEIQQTFTINVVDVNEAQTALTWTGVGVAENAAGAVAGTLWVADPDMGDSQTYAVSDGRFEVVNGQLKLKNGQSLDYETEPSVNLTVTAIDKGGHQIQQVFTVNVADVNEAPTAILLSNSSVAENAAGATVGKLTTADPDAGDTFTYQVSDARFEVVNGALKLKSGVSFDHESEPTVDLKVTSTDSAGHAIQQSFTVNVTNANEAPVVTVKDGSVESHIIDTSVTYGPSANATVGAYLYANDSAGLKVPDSSLLNGVAESNMTLTAPTEVTVTFQKEAAGNHNMVGTYQYDGAGNIIAGSVKFVWLDASAGNEGKLGAGMVNDFLGYAQSNTVSLGTMDAGTHIGFFTISNGANSDANKALLTAAATGAATQVAAMEAIADQLSIKIDANGNGRVYVGGSQMSGDVFFSHDKSLNTDFNGGNDIDHMASGVSSKLDNQLLVGVEDLNGGGDRDYNDVVFSVNLGTYSVDKTTQAIVQPSVDFSDVDSNSLSQAVIHTTGFQAGDSLSIPASGLFNVTVGHASNDYTITIVGKTGAETVDQYESFVNAIKFSTSSNAEGDRQIAYNIVDEGGLTSNLASAKIGVTTSYEISSSEIQPSQHELGSGNDHFYLNGSLKSTVDFGDGYDTLHLSRVDDGLSGSEKSRLDSVEAIDATGYGVNNVALSITDVLDMTDNSHHLTVIGDKGDVITLSGDKSGHHWSVADTGSEFTTYVWSDPVQQAVVEISNQLTAQLSS